VLESLGQAEQEAARREKALDEAPGARLPAGAREARWEECQEKLKGRLAGLEACAERARGLAEQAEAALGEAEAAARRWLEAGREAARQLAGGAGPRIE
jgi:hypothetical protein